MNKIKSYFSLSRNKRCNSVYLAQGFYNVDIFIKRHTGCFILFPGLDNVDVRNIANQQCGDVTKDKFIELYHHATKDRYNFFLFNKLAHDPVKMFRCCIDTFLWSNIVKRIKNNGQASSENRIVKKFLETRAAFKKKVEEARRGQVQAEEETVKLFKPITDAVLGKQPEISTLSPEELTKMKVKGLLGLLGER